MSYCHYSPRKTEHKLIGLDDLKEGIKFAMKENLNIQFVYPSYFLPKEYREVIETIDHTKIGPISCGEELDVVVIDDLSLNDAKYKNCLWRCSINELTRKQTEVIDVLSKVQRFNIVLTDILAWKEDAFVSYNSFLDKLVDAVVEQFSRGNPIQVNVLTDRLMIEEMNNCNAGDTSITLASDGRFYVCPGYFGKQSVGSLEEGLSISNQQLFRLDHAPICRKCDAFQCKRCVWMNEMSTLECNTPSHEQCVVAHLERRASCKLSKLLQLRGVSVENSYPIEEINYLDPFNILNKWN